MTTKIILIILASALLIGGFVFLTSCKSPKQPENKTERYKVICDEFLFENVKKSYAPGDKVEVYFSLIASDTDYSFYLDNERISNYEYSDKKGYIISFVMPDHDVELTFESKNSMEYIPVSPDAPEGTALLTYSKRVTSAEDSSVYEMSIYATSDPDRHLMRVISYDKSTTEYTISSRAYDSMYNYITSINIASWNDLEEYEALDGKVITLSVYDYGEYITVSSNHMPTDGESTLSYIHSNFIDHMTEENRK